MYYTIYKTTNLVNNKIYIGKHITKQLDDDYLGSGILINRSIKKYGIDKFKKEILYTFDNEKEMNDMEREIVNEEFISRLDTYNINLGGEGGFYHINTNDLNGLNKAIERMHTLRKDETFMCMYKEKLRLGALKSYDNRDGTFKNKKHTIESKKKISDANKILLKGEGNSQYGTMWIHNVETKTNKKIKKEELNSWIEQGWIKGRKMII